MTASSHIFDTPTESGRLYRIVNKYGEFLYWQAETRHKDADGKTGAVSAISDFQDGAFLGLTDDEKQRALTRETKA